MFSWYTWQCLALLLGFFGVNEKLLVQHIGIYHRIAVVGWQQKVGQRLGGLGLRVRT